jgi:membrane-associated phospholipid phosphatase
VGVVLPGFLLLFLLLWLLFRAVGPLMQRTLAVVGKRTASFRYRDYMPVVVVLAAGVFGTAFAADQFLDLAELVQGQSTVLQRVDAGVHGWARDQRSEGATLFFMAFTHLGSPVGLAIIIAIVMGFHAKHGRYRWAGYLLFTTGVGALLVVWLKVLFSRARPDLADAIRSAHGFSFPSGHAMGTTIVFGALSYLVLRAQQPWKYRAAGLAGATCVILAVSLSRVYLGVHWISDIGAGISAGLLWVLVTTVAYESFRRIRMIRAIRKRASAVRR